MKRRRRLSGLGLLWLAIALTVASIGAVLMWMNRDTDNAYRLLGVALEPVGVVMLGATGLVNQAQIRRRKSLAHHR